MFQWNYTGDTPTEKSSRGVGVSVILSKVSAGLGAFVASAMVVATVAPSSTGVDESIVSSSVFPASIADDGTGGGEVPALTERDLEQLGLTKKDADSLTQSVADLIETTEADGEISSREADVLREKLLTSPRSEQRIQRAALPLWAAAAIVGCAGSVVMGSGKTQIQNALKSGATIDQASDIAIDSAVDCVFGAVPGGAIGAAAKKALTGPIKSALRPHVKKVVENVDDAG